MVKKKKKINHSVFEDIIDPPRRKYYIDNRLEFSLFFDESIVDEDEIIEKFLTYPCWVSHSSVLEWKFVSAKFSEDSLRVDLKVKDTSKKQ